MKKRKKTIQLADILNNFFSTWKAQPETLDAQTRWLNPEKADSKPHDSIQAIDFFDSEKTRQKSGKTRQL